MTSNKQPSNTRYYKTKAEAERHRDGGTVLYNTQGKGWFIWHEPKQSRPPKTLLDEILIGLGLVFITVIIAGLVMYSGQIYDNYIKQPDNLYYRANYARLDLCSALLKAGIDNYSNDWEKKCILLDVYCNHEIHDYLLGSFSCSNKADSKKFCETMSYSCEQYWNGD